MRFGKSQIHYDIIRSSSRKRIEIVVVGKRSENVLAPENKSQADIRKIIKSNSQWIFRKQLNIEEKEDNALTYQHGSKLPYLGKDYNLYIKDANTNKNTPIFEFHKGKFIAKICNNDPNQIKIL